MQIRGRYREAQAALETQRQELAEELRPTPSAEAPARFVIPPLDLSSIPVPEPESTLMFSAPPSRSGTGTAMPSPGRVRLSPAQVAHAKLSGISPAEYALGTLEIWRYYSTECSNHKWSRVNV
jgi:hypothetical protein